MAPLAPRRGSAMVLPSHSISGRLHAPRIRHALLRLGSQVGLDALRCYHPLSPSSTWQSSGGEARWRGEGDRGISTSGEGSQISLFLARSINCWENRSTFFNFHSVTSSEQPFRIATTVSMKLRTAHGFPHQQTTRKIIKLRSVPMSQDLRVSQDDLRPIGQNYSNSTWSKFDATRHRPFDMGWLKKHRHKMEADLGWLTQIHIPPPARASVIV